MNTQMVCDGCGHVRGADKRAAEHECPACGRIYGKATEARQKRAIAERKKAEAADAEALRREQQRIDSQWEKNKICKECGWIGDGVLADVRGSGGQEFALWMWWVVTGILFFWIIVVPFVFLVVAISYSVWRRVGSPVCPACGAPAPLPVRSPRGAQLAATYASEWKASRSP